MTLSIRPARKVSFVEQNGINRGEIPHRHPLEGPLVRALDQQRTKALRRRMEVLIEAEEAKKRGTRALPASKEKLAIRVAQSMGRASEEELSDLRKSQALPMRPSHE